MKTIEYDRFGGIDELHEAERADPLAAGNQVVVLQHASSVNVIDSRVREGMMGPLVSKRFPKTPGADIAGIVVAVGPGVTRLAVGDRVFGAVDPFKGGAFAERVAVPVAQLALLPHTLDFATAAYLPVAGAAALLAMRDLGRVAAGQTVLVHGGSGGVGLLAIGVAKALGARVTAVSGSSGLAAMRAAGADEAIDYRAGEAYRERFDVILNASGAMPYARAKALLSPRGVLVEPSPTIPIVVGSAMANLFRRRKHKPLMAKFRTADLDWLAARTSEGILRPVIAARYPLAAVRDAFAMATRGGTVGKIVIEIERNEKGQKA